jgi:hypothetical protein
MNNKILMGSIIAVSLLIGVSFTSVVGVNSVESDVKISPLFNIRSRRAINQDGKGFTTDYVGKGEEIIIPLSDRNNIEVFIVKIIDRISKMDDKTINKFIFFAINKIKHSNNSDQMYIDELLTALPQIRENPKELDNFIYTDTNNSFATPLTLSDYCKIFWTIDDKIISCIAWYYIFIFAFLLDIIIFAPFAILAGLATILHLEKVCFFIETIIKIAVTMGSTSVTYCYPFECP